MVAEKEFERVTEQGSGREPAICELRCSNCGDGISFQQVQCMTCGQLSPRVLAESGLVS